VPLCSLHCQPLQVAATINYIRTENMYYPACPKDFSGRPCHKKLQDNGGSWWV